jgi:hypothetical protein
MVTTKRRGDFVVRAGGGRRWSSWDLFLSALRCPKITHSVDARSPSKHSDDGPTNVLISRPMADNEWRADKKCGAFCAPIDCTGENCLLRKWIIAIFYWVREQIGRRVKNE